MPDRRGLITVGVEARATGIAEGSGGHQHRSMTGGADALPEDLERHVRDLPGPSQ